MDRTSTPVLNARPLRREDIRQFPAAFEPKGLSAASRGELARALAAAFLKYSHSLPAVDPLTADEEAFLDACAASDATHQSLTASAERFLQEEMPIIQQGRPLDDLLMGFAGYRLSRASRAFYFESLTVSQPEELQGLKARVQACQQDFDNLMQAF